MGNQTYTGIWLSEFQDVKDEVTGEVTGVSIVYSGNLAITKPIDIFKNDSLTVTGDLTVSGTEGGLYMDGALTTLGSLTNDSFMYIGGTLTAGEAATNNGYYIQAAEATVNGTILDAGAGDHMKGYYVTNQAGWEAALADSAHCNPIIIASGASITVSTDTTITSNLIVQGNLTINTGVTFTLNMRFDNDIYGVMNNLSGTLINQGTLNLNMPLDVCGTLENYGTINMAGYDANEYGENWTTDGHIFLYTELNDEGAVDDQSGLFTNYGSIFNENTISVNHDSNMVNADTGVIDNYGRIESWDGINETNLFPLTNTGVIWGGEINLDYEGFFFTWTEWRELQDVGGYPAVAKDDRGSLYRGATVFPAIGEETYALYYHYYDEVKGEWVDDPIGVYDENLSVQGVNGSMPSDMTLEEWADLNPGDIAKIEDPDFTDYKFTKIHYSVFDPYMLSYNAGTTESPRRYYLPISVQLPELGYYRDASIDTADMENNYIKTFGDLSYVPNSPREERTFYAILNIDPDKFSEGYTTEYILYEGGDRVIVEPTYDESGESPTGDKRVFKVTIEDNVYGGFPLLMQVVVRNPQGEEMLRSEERFLWIDEQEAEGLVYSWPNDWRRVSQEGMEFDYPILSGGQNYETRAYVSLGNPTLALFHKYMGNDGWTYEPVAASDVTIIGQNPEMIAEDWAVANGIPENVTITDKEYANYKFTQVRCSKLGDYAISYTVGEGGETRTLTLPLTVMLPEVGFYSGASIDTQEMEANYIEEFAYTPAERTFYAILNTPEGYSVYWTDCNDSRVTVEQVPDSPVYSISVNENADQGFHVNFRAEFQNINNPEDKFTSDRWIWVYEGEYEGLVYRNLDWDGGAGGHFENEDWGFETRFYADPHEHVGIFYTKEYSQEENNGAGGWIYTPVDVQFDNEDMTIMPLEPGRIYSGDDRNTTNAPFYRSILFKGLGSYILEYTEDEKMFSLPLDVELPRLGAYVSTAIGMDTWLAEVDFARYRELYLIPFGVDMTDADLANSEFLMNGQPLNYDAIDDVFLLEDGGGSYLRVEPYREEGLIKHFTVTVLFTPFEQDFNLEYRIRDSENNEFINNQLHFYAPIDEAVSVVDGGPLETPVLDDDTGVTVEALGFNSVKYYSFTAGSLASDLAYQFKLAGAGESGSDKAKIFLFDESWNLLSESNWEDLREEGRAASIGTAALEEGKTYYVAVYNGANDPCDFQLTASVKTVPAMPTVEKFFDEALSVTQFKVSGEPEGQMYEIYVKIGDAWHHRGTQDFNTESDYQFWNAFDVINHGETVTAVGVTINNGGIQGERAELLITMERMDTDGVPMDVEVLHYPESNELLVTAADGVFESGVYYRLRHERPDGFWDFHSSFIGNGTDTVLCGSDGELENPADQYATSDGKYIVAAYSESDSAGILRLGWNYHVNVERTGEATTGYGSFDYDRPTTWLAIGEEDFNQDFKGYRIMGHSLSDGSTKFRLVTYDGNAVGDKYTFSQPLNVSDGLTVSAGLTLTDMTGEEAEFVKISPDAMGEYVVSYTYENVIYKAIISVNSPAPDDIFECIIDGAAGTVDVNVNIQSLRGREGETLNVAYALYDDGRMVGIATRSPMLRLNGFDDRVTVSFDPTAEPDTCKVFILNQGSYDPAMLNLIKGLSQ